MNRYFLGVVCLLCLTCAPSTLCSQEGANSDAGISGKIEDPTQRVTPLELQATLLLINADWTKGEDAEQIRSEVTKALEGKPIPEEYRHDPAAYGSRIWFLDDHATIYDMQDLLGLVSWLRKHKLLHGSYDATAAANDERGPARSIKNLELAIPEVAIPLPQYLPPLAESPFVRYRYEWQWTAKGQPILGENSFLLNLVPYIDLKSNNNVNPKSDDKGIVRQRLQVARASTQIPRDMMAVVPFFLDKGPESKHTINPPPNIDPIVIIYEAPAACPYFDDDDNSVEPELKLPTQLVPLYVHEGPQFMPPHGWDRSSSSPTEDSAPEIDVKPPMPTLRSFALKHAQVEQVKDVIQPFFSTPWNDQNIVFSADVRTNMLLVQAPEEVLQKVEAMILELDGPSATDHDPTSADFSQAMRGERPAEVKQLREDYLQSDRQARQLARQTQFNQQRGQDDPLVLELRQELRRAVAKAFAARQELHKAQIAELRQQLEELERTVQMRDKLQEPIIEERLEELLK